MPPVMLISFGTKLLSYLNIIIIILNDLKFTLSIIWKSIWYVSREYVYLLISIVYRCKKLIVIGQAIFSVIFEVIFKFLPNSNKVLKLMLCWLR